MSDRDHMDAVNYLTHDNKVAGMTDEDQAALISIINTLGPLDKESQIRVVGAVAVFLGLQDPERKKETLRVG